MWEIPSKKLNEPLKKIVVSFKLCNLEILNKASRNRTANGFFVSWLSDVSQSQLGGLQHVLARTLGLLCSPFQLGPHELESCPGTEYKALRPVLPLQSVWQLLDFKYSIACADMFKVIRV